MATAKRGKKKQDEKPEESVGDATEIVVLLDRSRSMEKSQESTQVGYDRFIAEQRAKPGKCNVTLVQFDEHDGQVCIETVYTSLPIDQVPPLVLKPRGNTPYHDALVKTILQTAGRIAAMPAETRPFIVFLTMTDGEENWSQIFKAKSVVKAVVEEHRALGWQFAFIGANFDALDAAEAYGIPAAAAANFTQDAAGIQFAYAAVTDAVTHYRSAPGASAKRAVGLSINNMDPRHKSDLLRKQSIVTGSVGGQARAANLTEEQRRESARNAAKMRWSNDPTGKGPVK